MKHLSQRRPAPAVTAMALCLTLCGVVGARQWAKKPPAHAVAVAAPQPAGPLVALEILPATIALEGPQARQQLVVEAHYADGHVADVTAQSHLALANPALAVLDHDFVLLPRRDGTAAVRAEFDGRSAMAPLTIHNALAPTVWSFRNQVLPVMTKVGCNSGPCHGAAAGKNGFKLTLRGYDPMTDYETLTRQADGRRTNPMDPARSLMLLKPTMTIPHGGGRRFAVHSLEYDVISGWIASGLPAPRADDPSLQDLEVLPQAASLRPGSTQQLIVRAKFSDGHVQDVTRWAMFGSNDASVASVDQNGRVKMTGNGEAPVTVWYLSHVAFARMRVPFPGRNDDPAFLQAAHYNHIDDLVLGKLAALHIPPSPLATDGEFIRRAFLDADGILPSPREVETFLADTRPDKRARLVDALLARPEYVDYWTNHWSDLLLVSSNKLSGDEMWSYSNWIRQSVASDKPWDQFARELLTASGSTRQDGAANFYAIHPDPLDLSETVAKAFLGMSIGCAKCHNHPLEKWTQSDYYRLANLFSRVRLKNRNSDGREVFNDISVVSSPTGEVLHPRLGRPMRPRPPDGPALALDSPVDRRVFFANWLTAPSNRTFANAVINRVWKYFLGRGLVEPVDDLRATNPPSNQKLLDALTDDFIAHHYDLRHLIREIMNSATYQRASTPLPRNQQDDRYYSHYLVRRLPAEVLLDAMSQVTQSPERFAGYPFGMRAVQLPDTKVNSYFLSVYGRPPREQTNAAERMSTPSITQALHVINGDTLNEKLGAKGGTLDMLTRLGVSDGRMLDYLYLAALSRYPTAPEKTEFLRALGAAREPQELSRGAGDVAPAVPRDRTRHVWEDLMWALMTSKDFTFNH